MYTRVRLPAPPWEIIMANIGIVWYPRKILRTQTKRVKDIALHREEFYERISQMFSIMYYRNGVGLAAPQVGWNVSLFVANPTGDRATHETDGKVFINPSIVGLGDTTTELEGCLSFPGVYAEVERNESVSIRYANLDKDGIEEEHDGFMARIIQHEFDHLNGVLFIDRLTDEVRQRIQPKLDSHKERIKRLRKKRLRELKEAEARKKKRAEKRRKQRKKRNK